MQFLYSTDLCKARLEEWRAVDTRGRHVQTRAGHLQRLP